MKKLIPLFFIFTFIRLFSQEYHFDYYLKYRHELTVDKGKPEIRDFQHIVNSKNYFYQITFQSESKNKLSAILTDFKNSLQHHFDLKNTDFPLKGENFVYKFSVRIPSVKKQFENEAKHRFFKAELLDKRDGNLYNYSIKEFSDEKMNKERLSANVVFAGFNDNLSFVGLRLLFDYHEIYNKIKFENNGILKSATGKSNNRTYALTLLAIEPHDFDIKVNEAQLRFKD
ncbi:hypothetical protein [Chryseobacterium hagamense]|uniref:Uncharacterized protein n=1 Tax=Chryseobacterium hagamense TaxID=395935 RepID=A0A511YJQ1_9FLAO|nr:hypothetical protein [Chryseobacterium hagamense]GEN75376.1 hypothetical protein CHA01nite_11160 [Chryseobacterium hagamense]